MLERLLDAAGDRQLDRLAAGDGAGQLVVERAFDAGDSAAVDVGVADDVGAEAGLRVQPVGLALDRQARLADGVDRLHQRRRRPALQIDEALVGAQHRVEIGFVAPRHQRCKPAGDVELVADDLARVDADGPRVDGAGERLAVAVHDVAALGH